MTIKKLSKLIDKIKTKPDEPRPYIGASSIGSDCMRQIWYGYKGYEGEQHTPRMQRNIDIGKRFESMVLDWLEAAGVKVERPSEKNNYLSFSDNEITYFCGHADALLPKLDAVIDVKVIKASSWREFVRKGLFSWSPVYYAQLQSYMGMGDIPYAYLMALNKDTGELHDERIAFDANYYKSLKMRAEMIAISESEPPRVSNHPGWWLCKICKYKGVCHK